MVQVHTPCGAESFGQALGALPRLPLELSEARECGIVDELAFQQDVGGDGDSFGVPGEEHDDVWLPGVGVFDRCGEIGAGDAQLAEEGSDRFQPELDVDLLSVAVDERERDVGNAAFQRDMGWTVRRGPRAR